MDHYEFYYDLPCRKIVAIVNGELIFESDDDFRTRVLEFYKVKEDE